MQGKSTYEEKYYGSPALGFKMALKEKFERELLFFTEDRMHALEKSKRYDDDCLKLFKSFTSVDEKKYQLSIADIKLAFDHGDMIPLLRKRGIKLAKHKWESAQQIDKKIDKLIKKHPEKDLFSVVAAYITFNTEFGRNQGMYLSTSQNKLLNFER